jgi:hypothetical protein
MNTRLTAANTRMYGNTLRWRWSWTRMHGIRCRRIAI